MSTDDDGRFELAKAIAIEGGNLAVSMREAQRDGFRQRMGHQDFVTAADLAVESLVRRCIQERFPEDSVLGEEQGISGSRDSVWIVDPIDGTTNYMRGMPECAVSIVYCKGGSLGFGAIYAPDIATLGAARKGQGATLNTAVARVSGCDREQDALVLLGRSDREGGGRYVNCIKAVLAHGMEYRRNGSAAYSLLAVAAGRAEAYYEAHLNPWDVAAGLVIIEEASGKVRHPSLVEFLAKGGPVLASNAPLHDKIASIIDRVTELRIH